MCGGCRVLLDEGAQFVCVDGPEFDAHKVDWENRSRVNNSTERAGGNRSLGALCRLERQEAGS